MQNTAKWRQQDFAGQNGDKKKHGKKRKKTLQHKIGPNTGYGIKQKINLLFGKHFRLKSCRHFE